MSSSQIGKGYLHIYTGCGKGKTSAAVGLSARALGADLRVFFAQFIKSSPSAEFRSLERAGGERFVHCQFGRGCFIIGPPEPEDMTLAQCGLTAVREAVTAHYDLIVMDEAIGALNAGLFALEELMALLETGVGIEWVLTGRNAPQALIDRADLVSEIREIKHYYTQAVPARLGIEF